MCIVTPMFGCSSGVEQLGAVAVSSSFDMEGSDLPEPPKLRRMEAVMPNDANVAPPRLTCLRATLKPRVRRGKPPPRQFFASARGDAADLALWLNEGGDPNARDADGWALLLHASMHGRNECVRLLLRHGAAHDVYSIAGHTPLHGAAANRHCSVVESLVEAGAEIDVRNSHGNTPLHSAAATGTVEVVSYLLSRSADPDVINSDGETADKVKGAGPAAHALLQEARREKQARIAQRLALVGIQILRNSGRAHPHCTPSPSSDQSPTYHGHAVERRHPSKETDFISAWPEIRPGVHADGNAAAENYESRPNLHRQDSATLDESLALTVAGVTALPHEVFRRLVSLCRL